MKKLLLLVSLVVASFVANAQTTITLPNLKEAQKTIFVSTTHKSDGYLTVGYAFNNFGVYGGKQYFGDIKSGLGVVQTGTIPEGFQLGIFGFAPGDKFMAGAGVKGSQINLIGGFAPLTTNEMKLWLLGDVTGGKFTMGVGLSYKIPKK
jgi:hypothetical protein